MQAIAPPYYRDPDVQEAESLAMAAAMLERAGRLDQAAAIVSDLEAMFEDVPYDRIARKKQIGSLSYMPSGFMSSTDGSIEIRLAARPYEASLDTEAEAGARDMKKIQEAFKRGARCALLGWLPYQQIKYAVSGGKIPVRHRGLAQAIRDIAEMVQASEKAAGSPAIQAEIGRGLRRLTVDMGPSCGPSSAKSAARAQSCRDKEHITEGPVPSSNGYDRYAAAWLPKAAAEQAAARILASKGDDGTIRAAMQDAASGKRIAWLPPKPYPDAYAYMEKAAVQMAGKALEAMGRQDAPDGLKDALHGYLARFMSEACCSGTAYAWLLDVHAALLDAVSRDPDDLELFRRLRATDGAPMPDRGLAPKAALSACAAMDGSGLYWPSFRKEWSSADTETFAALCRESAGQAVQAWFGTPEAMKILEPKEPSYARCPAKPSVPDEENGPDAAGPAGQAAG